MQRYRKEACRNFQRGFCQYGERCKFLHQQPQSSNTNPFSFANNDKQQQFKPFENKWSRSSNAPSSQQQQQQPDAIHKCTDPQACKRLIVEDFQNERPLWKLTCYSHWKGLSCDIAGDVSYEELRAAAYDDAKRGISLQSIVERERNLVNSKLQEFDSLLRNPYPGPAKSGLGSSTPFSGQMANAVLPTNYSSPPSVSSFSQLGATLNMGTGVRPSTPSTPFGQPSSISTSNQLPNAFGMGSSSLSSAAFAHHNSFPDLGQISNLSGQTNFPFASSGRMTGHPQQEPFKSSTPSNGGGFANNMEINSQSSMAGSAQNLHLSTDQPLNVSTGQPLASVASRQASTGVQLISNTQMESVQPVDESIWLKEKWVPGEIPEEAPPDSYCY